MSDGGRCVLAGGKCGFRCPTGHSAWAATFSPVHQRHYHQSQHWDKNQTLCWWLPHLQGDPLHPGPNPPTTGPRDTLQSWSTTWGMKFNPSKCNILRTRQGLKGTLNRFYQLHGEILAKVPTAKYLGVNISNNLSWTPHVDYVGKKANQKLGSLRCPVSSKCLTYTSLVRSGLEYAAPIWDPITDKDSWKIESIQRRAARWAKSTYSPRASVTELLQELGWDDLLNRRKNLRLTFLYKIFYHQVAVDYTELDITRNPRPSRQHEHQIRQLPTRKNTFLFSFVPIPSVLTLLPPLRVSCHSVSSPSRSRVGHLWHLGTIVQIQIQRCAWGFRRVRAIIGNSQWRSGRLPGIPWLRHVAAGWR